MIAMSFKLLSWFMFNSLYRLVAERYEKRIFGFDQGGLKVGKMIEIRCNSLRTIILYNRFSQSRLKTKNNFLSFYTLFNLFG